MKVDIYKSATSDNKYISVAAGTDVSKVEVDDPAYAKLIRQSSGVEIEAGGTADAAVNDISRNGYHLHVVRYPIN